MSLPLFLRGSLHSYTAVQSWTLVHPCWMSVCCSWIPPNSAVKFSSVLARFLCCCGKHHDQKQHWEERVYLAYQTLSITAGSQDMKPGWAGTCKQELMQRPWKVLLTGLLLVACSVLCHTVAELVSLTLIISQENVPQACLQSNLMELRLVTSF